VNINTNQESRTEKRKKRHLEICTNPSRYTVEKRHIPAEDNSPFSGIRFIHRAFPEISTGEVDTAADFLGYRISMPLLISCMTGGSDPSGSINKELALAADAAGIPVGMGSIRILFEKPERAEDFRLKEYAPHVPVIANIGAVQVRDLASGRLIETVQRLNADALAIHLNPGQELFQEEGDRDFRRLLSSVTDFADTADFPVIVKETGFGIDPRTIERLLESNIAYVDLAGSGGTNWAVVEYYRDPDLFSGGASDFSDWGIPTDLLLASLSETGRIIASGGIHNGMSFAKALALGAPAAGCALPFARAAAEGGRSAVTALIERFRKTLQTVMMLTGARVPRDLSRPGSFYLRPGFRAEVEAFTQAAACTY
jgi:isopentenyl-diphosphate delta-isomerase type 2